MQKEFATLHAAATAPALGPVVPAPGVDHAFQVVAVADGAVSVTINPRWALEDPGTDAADLASIDGPKVVSGTDRVVHVFTVSGAVGVVACPIEALTGTDAEATVSYLGAE